MLRSRPTVVLIGALAASALFTAAPRPAVAQMVARTQTAVRTPDASATEPDRMRVAQAMRTDTPPTIDGRAGDPASADPIRFCKLKENRPTHHLPSGEAITAAVREQR